MSLQVLNIFLEIEIFFTISPTQSVAFKISTETQPQSFRSFINFNKIHYKNLNNVKQRILETNKK